MDEPVICQLAKIEKPISPHELRHTYATVCISKGVNPLVVSRRMGHANLEQTYGYVHLLKDVEKEADELLEDLISDNLGVKSQASKNENLVNSDISEMETTVPEDMGNEKFRHDIIPKKSAG